MSMRNQKEFSLVEALLILVVAGIIGGAGCGMYGDRKDAGKRTDNAGSASVSGAEQTGGQKGRPAEPDETAGWEPYISAEGKFSLRHPKNWVRPANPEDCTPGLFMAGANAESAGACASDSFGQIYVSSTEGDHISDHKLATNAYPYQNVTSQQAPADNIKGTRETGTAKGQMSEQFAMPGLPDGTKVVVYSFYAHGRTYVAQYTQRSGDPDVLRDFDLMVTKTLKFSN
jgi:hypothetical protein